MPSGKGQFSPQLTNHGTVDQFAEGINLFSRSVLVGTCYDPSPHASHSQDILQLAGDKGDVRRVSSQGRKYSPGSAVHTQ